VPQIPIFEHAKVVKLKRIKAKRNIKVPISLLLPAVGNSLTLPKTSVCQTTRRFTPKTELQGSKAIE
jgi:hypothetical protein